MKLQRVEQWTEGKAPFPALVGAMLVMWADDLHSMMVCQTNHKEFANLFSIKDIEIWSSMYQRFLGQITTDMESKFSVVGDTLTDMLPELTSVMSQLGDISDLNQPPFIDFIRSRVLDNFELNPEESNEDERLNSYREVLQIPCFIFAMKLFMPTMILYQSTPYMLLKQAQKGNIESLAHIASLDKSFWSVPELAIMWESISRNPLHPDFQYMTRAIAKTPLKTISITRTKTALALAIQGLFTISGSSITAELIRDAFDAYAQDVKGSTIDVDLPDSQDGFRKALQREKNRWLAAIEQHS